MFLIADSIVLYFYEVKAELTSMDDLIASIDEQYTMIRRDQKVAFRICRLVPFQSIPLFDFFDVLF